MKWEHCKCVFRHKEVNFLKKIFYKGYLSTYLTSNRLNFCYLNFMRVSVDPTGFYLVHSIIYILFYVVYRLNVGKIIDFY